MLQSSKVLKFLMIHLKDYVRLPASVVYMQNLLYEFSFTATESSRDATVLLGSLTFCAEPRTGCKLGHIHNFDSKLLTRLSVDASPDHAERTPEQQKVKRGGKEERKAFSAHFILHEHI